MLASNFDLDAKIEAAVREAGPSGLHQQQLEALREPRQSINEAVQRLAKSRRIDIIRNNELQQIVLFIPATSGGLSEAATYVLEVIKSSGGEGIDVPGITAKTKLLRMEITKALKSLLDKKIIEETRSFTNKAKKVYIQAGVALSHSVTGGVFYNTTDGGKNREIDFNFVDNLRAAVMDVVNNFKVVSTGQIKNYLDSKSLAKALSQKEVDIVTRTLQLDGLLEQVDPQHVYTMMSTYDDRPSSSPLNSGGGTYYCLTQNGAQSILRVSTLGQESTVATQMPCMGCPLINRCSSSGFGPINPTNCAYLNDWLRLE